MARPSGSAFREVLRGVRLNFSLIVVLLVTLSVSSLGIVLLAANDDEVTLTSDEVQEVINDNQVELAGFISNNPDAVQDIAIIADSVRADSRRDIRQLLSFYTPIFVIGSGFVAFATARYLVKPIRESYSSQERFLQDAAHELRNPLGAMKVTVQSVQNKENITKEDIDRVITSVDRQVNRLIAINENLLFLDKKSTKAQKEHRVNASELLLDVIEDQQPNAAKHNITIRHQIDQDILLTVRSEDFVRIMRNLIENAIKYSGELSDEIRIALSRKNNKVRISIRDFGVGIPEQELYQVGERFYRASNTSQFEGTGLGLAIVKKIVRANNGALTIKSHVNEGTHIVINF